MISYGAFILLIVLSIVSPLLAAIYVLLVVIALLVRAMGIVYHTLMGHRRLVLAQRVNWAHRLAELNGQLPAPGWFQQQLARHGYAVPLNGQLDEATRNVIAAFQMRYRPARFDGVPDLETAALLLAVPTSMAAPAVQTGSSM